MLSYYCVGYDRLPLPLLVFRGLLLSYEYPNDELSKEIYTNLQRFPIL